MTLTDPDRPDADRPALSPPGRGRWTPLTRAAALVALTLGLAALVGQITITVRLSGVWPAACTVEPLAAAVYAAVIVRVAAATPVTPARGGRR